MGDEFKDAVLLGSLLARGHAEGMLRLLATYRSVSASEAASRLGLHIKTAQDFLDGLAILGVAAKEEACEGKRPYFRYALKKSRLTIDLDLHALFGRSASEAEQARRIREKKNSGARFSVGRDGDSISSVAAWTGIGRERQECKINLTDAQGRFLYLLPFPGAEPLAVAEILLQAGVDAGQAAEIFDLVDWLTDLKIIEVNP